MNPEILYLCPGSPLDGAPHPFMAAYWLRAQGHSVRIVCHGEGRAETIGLPLGTIPIVGIKGGTFGYFRGCLLELLKARRDCTNVLFYIHGHVSTLPAYFALRGLPSTRLLYHTQDYLEPGRHPHWEFFERRVARHAGWVISNEPNRARFLASHYRLHQMPLVVTTALPRDWPRPERDPQLRRAILASVGRHDGDDMRLIMHEGTFAPIRCGQQLVEAFRHLPDHFVLVFTGLNPGGSATQELEQVVNELGFAKRIVLLERLSFGELMRHTACCDAGILLYPNDGIGNYYQAPGRLTHYIGCGLPVVASNFVGLELLVLKHRLGEVCDPTSPQSIAHAILRVAGTDSARLREQRIRLRQLAQTELAYESHAWKIEDAVRKASKANQ